MTDNTPTESTTDTNTTTDHFKDIPHNGDVINKDIVDDTLEGKRRAEKTSYRVITEGSGITRMQDEDLLVRKAGGGQVENEITEIGPNICDAEGIHVLLDGVPSSMSMNPLHLDLVRRWVDRGDAVIYGTRKSELSEIEGVDYDI